MNKKNSYRKFLPCLIIFINICMNLAFISKENFSNEYYTAAVKSMLKNFKNFFFVSFDPSGFLTVDKPPLGLWLQAISAKIFGLNTFAILLPSIISSALVCFLIYKIISNTFGEIYGIISQIVFCFTPIVVAVSRTNNLDMILMLFMTLAIYFAIKNRFMISMIMLGLAFNVKMFQAYMIAPALIVYFFMTNKFNLKTLGKFLISLLILFVVSFSWTAIVELTPKDSRPFIGGSGSDNSVISLMFGHNGFDRLFGKKMENKNKFEFKSKIDNEFQKNFMRSYKNDKKSRGFDETGNPGFFRLFNLTGASMYEQISWLIIPALFSVVAIIFYKKLQFLTIEQIKVIILWSICILPMIIFFNIAGFFHRYYLAMMAPSIACLFATTCYILKNISQKLQNIFVPILYVFTFFIQICFVVQNGQYWLFIIMLIEFILSTILFLLHKKILFISILISLITAPFIWSFYPILGKLNSVMPTAEINEKNFNFKQKNDSILKEFLLNNASDEKYFFIISNCNVAANLILNTDLNIILANGFEGTDQALTLEKLKTMIKNNQVKYYMGNNAFKANNAINDWVKENATIIYIDDFNNKKLYCFQN